MPSSTALGRLAALLALCIVGASSDISKRDEQSSYTKPELDTSNVNYDVQDHNRERRQVNVCASQQCQALLSQIKSGGQYSFNTETTCVNSVCQDEITVRLSDGSTKVYVCNGNGCGLKGNVPSQNYNFPQPSPVQNNDDGIFCMNRPCRDLVIQLRRNGGYSKVDMRYSCQNSQCEDTVTVLFTDGTKRIHKCNRNGCTQIGNNVALVDYTVPNGLPQTSDNRILCRNQFCKDFINKLISEVSFSKYDIQTTCLNNKCEDVITVHYRDYTKSIHICNEYGCQIKVEPINTMTVTTTPTRRPPSTSITTSLIPVGQTGVRGGCVEDSDCEGHYICFNGCVDPCRYCGENAECVVIQKTSSCRCPDHMQGDPTKACTLKPVGGDTNLFPVSRTGCVLPTSRGAAMSFCPSRCTEGCKAPGSACHLPPGSLTQLDTVRVQCAAGFGLDDERRAIVPCDNGVWLQDFPSCLALCPPLKSDSMDVQCWAADREINCLEGLKPGTRATFKCKQSYSQLEYLAAVYANGIVCGSDGTWNKPLPDCKPDCGVPVALNDIQPSDQLFDNKLNNGEDAALGMYPWHAGLYKYDSPKAVWEYFCGGSLVTSRSVITAAHCIYERKPIEIQVALGKVYRTFDREEKTAEIRSVIRIALPPEFTGNTYSWDIGLLLLNKPIQFSRYVMPVCQNARYTLDIIYRSPAFVAGWGTTQQDQRPEILQHTNFSIVDMAVCRKEVPSALAGHDRFCGEHQESTVSVAEKGDSGGGVTLVFNNKHFIVGVVSINYKQSSIFTNVTYEYIQQWTKTNLNKFEAYSMKLG